MLYGYIELHFPCKTEYIYEDVAKDVKKRFNT